MNKVILIGRLTKDPEIRVANENTIARFSLAVERKFKKEGAETVDFPNCVAFGKTAEIIEKYMKKGTKICVEGRLQTGSYTNKDNVKVYTTDIVVENVEFSESKSKEGNTGKVDFTDLPDDLDDEGLPFN